MATKRDAFEQGPPSLGGKLPPGMNGGVLVPVPEGAPGPLYPPKYGWVRLRTIDLRLQLDLRLDEDPAGLTPQVARVDDIEIPYRMSRSVWAGQTRDELTIPCLLDGWPWKSVEAQIAVLKDMAKPVSAGKASGAPAPLQVAGIVDGSELLWMLTGIEPGEPIWAADVTRRRQHYTLSLTRWEPLEKADIAGRKNQRKSTGDRTKRQPVTVREGETLATIASQMLGSASRWKEIAAANKRKGKARRSPDDLTPGEKLRMPQT